MRRLSCLLFAVAVAACHPAKPAVRPLPPIAAPVYAAYMQGKLAGYRGDWISAVASLRVAAAAAPDQPMIAVELARSLVKAKNENEARATLERARTTWPDHSEVWRVSGDLLSTTDKPKAIAAYQRAIELSPDDEDAYLGLAKLQEPADEEVTLRALVAKVPTSVEGQYRLAVRQSDLGQTAKAMASLRHVLELDPDHLDARLDLARALRRTGKMTEAIAQTRSAFDRSGQALDIAEELYWLLCEADDRQAAIDLLTLLDDDRSDLDALSAVARFQRGLGRLDEAKEIVDRIGVVDPELAAVLHAEIISASAPAEAASTMLAVPADSAHFVDARKIAASALLATGDTVGAADAIAPIRAAKPDDTEAALLDAYSHADAGDRAAGQTIVDALGTAPAAILVRARYADHVSDTVGALALLDPFIVKHPDSLTALNLAGYLLADGNQRLPDAEKWLRHARDISPGDPAILDSWGWLLYRKGDHREAVRILDRAARFAPTEAEILYHLAAAWAADGAPRTALTVLDQAATLRPTAAVRKRIETLRSTLVATR
ncbi:MAG TPA: tetratricopeptide repeat protein [Kofleriaceae bacterium]|jgi:tetratricopeptide (TPR) repeat protein